MKHNFVFFFVKNNKKPTNVNMSIQLSVIIFFLHLGGHNKVVGADT